VEMERGSTSYTHMLITHFSPSFRSVCMSVSVGVRTRAYVRARMPAHENKEGTNYCDYQRIVIYLACIHNEQGV